MTHFLTCAMQYAGHINCLCDAENGLQLAQTVFSKIAVFVDCVFKEAFWGPRLNWSFMFGRQEAKFNQKPQNRPSLKMFFGTFCAYKQRYFYVFR